MSFNWCGEVEEKEYESSEVTISTEEYRDLISDVARYHFAGQKEHDDWYREYRKREELESKLAKINKFFEECPEIRIALEEWNTKTEVGEA